MPPRGRVERPVIKLWYKVMEKLQTTRTLIIDTALVQSAKVGLEGVSLGGIATAIGMSKSGLFAHFKSKEALQLAVLEEAISRFRATVILPALNNSQGLVRLKAYYENYLDWIAGTNAKCACPFTTFVQEYDDRPGAIRTLLVKSQKIWRDMLADAARDAIEEGEMSEGITPEQISFELIGAALSYQVSLNLLKSKASRPQAISAFEHIINRKE